MGLLQLGIDPTSLAVLAFAAWGAFQAYKIIYRLYFHPLAHFPGPKFAAVSFLYEIYFDLLVAPGGQFIYRLDELHDKYGPVIRCSPEEIHVRDSQWFDTLYTGPGHVRSKWSKSIRANGSPGSVASAESHDLHRERRAALNPFFSKKAVDEVELSIRSKVEKMCQKFHDCAKERKIVELGTAFTAVTLDVITEYCYNNCFDVLSEPDFAPRWKQLMVGLFESATAMKHFPVVLQVLKTLPAPVLKILNPQLTLWVEAQHVIQGQARRVWSEESKAGRIQPVARGEERAKTVFHGMLQSNLSNEEKRMQRMADEAFVLIVAGAETTAKVITVTLAYLLEDEVLCARLRNALVEKMQAGLPSSRELEDIPLMKAIVQEGLRISAAVANRQILIAPDEHLQCQDWTIPSGVYIPCLSLCPLLIDVLTDSYLHDATKCPLRPRHLS